MEFFIFSVPYITLSDSGRWLTEMIFQLDQYRWNTDYKELFSTYPDQIGLWLWQISSFYREQFGQHPEPETKEKFECEILDWPLVNPCPRNLYLQHHYVNLISVIINLLASCSHSYPQPVLSPCPQRHIFPLLLVTRFTYTQHHLGLLIFQNGSIYTVSSSVQLLKRPTRNSFSPSYVLTYDAEETSSITSPGRILKMEFNFSFPE